MEMKDFVDETFNNLLGRVCGSSYAEIAKDYKEIFQYWMETRVILAEADKKIEEMPIQTYEGKSASEIFALKWNGVLPESVSCHGGGAKVNILTRDWSDKDFLDMLQKRK